MKKRLDEAIIVGIFLLILAVISCNIYESNIDGNRENAIVFEEKDEREQQKDTRETIEVQEETENQYLVYDNWHSIVDQEEWDMPYTDQKTFETIQSAYEEVEFFGEFEKGNLEVYDEYIELFVKLVRNEKPFWDKETGEEKYLKDYVWGGDYDANVAEYYFFDVDGDSYPELGVVYNCQKYIFKYDSEEKKYILWYKLSTWGHLIGTRKVHWRNLEKYFSFYQLDENGEGKRITLFYAAGSSEGNIYVVMLPKYEEKEKKVEVTDEMKEQGMFVRSDSQWYFRVTGEQYEELTETYWEADFQAEEELEEVTYTYDELFGSLE